MENLEKERLDNPEEATKIYTMLEVLIGAAVVILILAFSLLAFLINPKNFFLPIPMAITMIFLFSASLAILAVATYLIIRKKAVNIPIALYLVGSFFAYILILITAFRTYNQIFDYFLGFTIIELCILSILSLRESFIFEMPELNMKKILAAKLYVLLIVLILVMALLAVTHSA